MTAFINISDIIINIRISENSDQSSEDNNSSDKDKNDEIYCIKRVNFISIDYNIREVLLHNSYEHCLKSPKNIRETIHESKGISIISYIFSVKHYPT